MGKELLRENFQVDMNIMHTLKIWFNKFSSTIGPCIYQNWDQKQSSKQESYLEPSQILNTVISILFSRLYLLPPEVPWLNGDTYTQPVTLSSSQ